MTKTIRTSAIALTIASLASIPMFASANQAELEACFEAFSAEHLPEGPSIGFEAPKRAQPPLSALTHRKRATLIDLTATDTSTGDVIAVATCRVAPNGTVTITPARRADLLAAN